MTTTSVKNLVREESLQFIRSQTLQLSLSDARPNTRLYVFFDEQEVTHLCKALGNTINDPIVTNANGVCQIMFDIPPGAFTVGDKQIIVADTNEIDLIKIPGTVNGSAKGMFRASGKIQFFQETQTTTVKKQEQKQLLNPPSVTVKKTPSGGGWFPAELNNAGGASQKNISNELAKRGINLSPMEVNQALKDGVRRDIINAGQKAASRTSNLVDLFEANYKKNNPQDPIAQSFFTYGIDGGFFLSSIDLFFRTKDESIPVRMEIREMVNGFPSELPQGNPTLVSFVLAEVVSTSENASEPTRFYFDPPVYIPEDKDYCFVVLSNSNQYNLFTSKMGERSIENGQIIFENPFIGSVFKSENNITWTPEQFEDIKFTMNRAVFDTSTEGVVEFKTEVPMMIAKGEQFTTEQGSSIITYVHNQEHGLEVSNKIYVNAFAHGEYNGIPGNALTGEFVTLSTPDRNTVTFDCGANASMTGQILYANTIVALKVTNGGSNYDSNTTISFSSGSATANAIVSGGKLVRVDIDDPGSGYLTVPVVTVNSSVGSGAQVTALNDAMFTVCVNKPMTHFTPKYNTYNFRDTRITNKIQTTIGNYAGGNLVTYNLGKEVEYNETDDVVELEQNSLVASDYNEDHMMSGLESGKITIELKTDSKYQSPMIDLRKPPELEVISFVINNQSGEDLTSSNTTASIQTIAITNGGAGYTANPNVIIIGNGANATANAVVTAGSVTTINVLTPGDGFTKIPSIVIQRHPSDTTGVGAAAQAVLTPFNTELLPTGGNAKSKYITRKTSLETISTGIRLYAEINSGRNSSVDWYFRGSLSGAGLVHEDLNWVRMNCDVSRNKSQSRNEIYEYEFYLNNISEFDVYDLKCVMLSSNPLDFPSIQKYSAVAIA